MEPNNTLDPEVLPQNQPMVTLSQITPQIASSNGKLKPINSRIKSAINAGNDMARPSNNMSATNKILNTAITVPTNEM